MTFDKNFETLPYNPFSAEATLNDNPQHPDINFYQDDGASFESIFY